MAVRGKVSPLTLNDKFVDPETGKPTLQFLHIINLLLQNEGLTFDDTVHAQATADAAVPQTRRINTTSPVTGGGTLAADLTLDHATSGVTPGSYTRTSLTVNDRGHITAASNGTASIVFGIEIDGGGSVITTGVKGFVRIPMAHTITKVTCLSDDASATAGSITVDVWRDSYANYPPTAADKISASAPVTLSSASKSEDSTLTGWSKSGNAGDVYGFSVASVTTVTKVLIEIEASI